MLTALLGIVGAAVCYSSLRSGQWLVRHGFWMFTLIALGSLYGLSLRYLTPALVEWVQMQGMVLSRFGMVMGILGLPAQLLQAAGLLVMLLGLVRYQQEADLTRH